MHGWNRIEANDLICQRLFAPFAEVLNSIKDCNTLRRSFKSLFIGEVLLKNLQCLIDGVSAPSQILTKAIYDARSTWDLQKVCWILSCMILDEGGLSAYEKEMLFAEDSKWRFSQLGNILTMDVLVMTDILIIALGNVNFSKGRKVLKAYWMPVVGECLIFLSALNPPLYSPFGFNGIQVVSFHTGHWVNTEEVSPCLQYLIE